MPRNMLAINPDIKNAVMTVGGEKTPIIIIDNFVSDTDSLVEYVRTFVDMDSEQQTYYPGFRAKIVDEYKKFVASAIGRHLYKPFSIPENYGLVIDSAYYSMVGTPPEQLLAAQSRPHTDSSLPHYLAVMHYLSPGDHGGTGFFRHKPTGFERISAARMDRYLSSAAEFRSAHGSPEKAYVTASSEEFELIGEIGYKPNRVIIYPGCLLHSGLINPATDLNRDPRLGRLTANIFLQFLPA